MARRFLVLVVLVIGPVLGGFAFGRGEILPPAIVPDLSETTYISPGLADGVQDEATFTVTITASERMVVKGYRIIVTDEGGGEVYRFEEFNPARQPRIPRFKRPVTVPDSLGWAGTSTAGEAVPEGRYDLVIEGVDDRDRVGRSEVYSVVVDNTPPAASVSAPYAVFSPNADGNKDILVLEQSGSTEATWTGRFEDRDGNEVFSTSWSGAGPANLVWDGRMSVGEPAPDGTYNYVLSATDPAGNTFSTTVASIVIDTRDTPISLTRDVGFFSPNGDNSVDTVDFAWGVPVAEGISEWTFEILDSAGAPRRTVSGQTIRDRFVFDGRNDRGETLAEGTYTGRLSILYENGNNPTAVSSPVVVDLTPPSISLTAEATVFSPNGDGSLDATTFFQDTSTEVTWTGQVLGVDNESVRKFEWRTRPEFNVVWDGTDDSGAALPDGMYRYVLSSTDRAGNYAEASVESIRIDTRETPVSLSADSGFFSPNADGNRDSLRLIPEIADPNGITELTLRITDTSGSLVRQFRRSEPAGEFVWAGRNSQNQNAPDGSYFAELSVQYLNGNNPSSRIGPIVVDRVKPRAEVRTDTFVFSPDGDGSLDVIEITQSNSTQEETWTGTFTNEAGDIVREIQWNGLARSFTWDGTDADGNRLADGTYVYKLVAVDRAGNSGEFGLDPLSIDTRPTPVSVRIGRSAFSPNGDGIGDNLLVTPVLEVADNIQSWALEVLNSAAAVRRRLAGVGSVPDVITLDGTDDAGSVLPEGSYTARLSVLYRNGNQPVESSPAFDIDLAAPTATVRAAGNLFSPNGDGRKDTVQFEQFGTAEDVWTGLVKNSDGQTVREFTFRGDLPAVSDWDGLDNDGRLVPDGSYVYSLNSTDRAGNSGASGSARVRVDNRNTSLAVNLGASSFSPNGDGSLDTLVISPVVALNEGITSYRLEMTDRSGLVVRTIRGTGAVPARMTWQGQKDNGDRVADGTYSARLTVEYEKGDQPVAQTPSFVVDTQAPTATVRAAQLVFSPEGDGRRDTVTISQQTSAEELWEGVVLNDRGESVRSAFWNGAAEDFVWDGLDDNGSRVSDGLYSYRLRASDRAGNSVERSVTGIRVDTRVTSAFINPSESVITPNGDGNLDSVRINLYPSLNEGVGSWSLAIVNRSGRVVRDLTSGSQRSVPGSVTWNGQSADGVVDGAYNARLTVEYEKGNRVEALSTSILVDTTGPQFNVATSPTPFSPDQDGVNDTATISISRVTDASAISGWQIQILDPFDKVFFERRGTGPPVAAIQWDGLSASGELVQAAEDYVVSVTVVDAFGNSNREQVILPIDVLVLRDGDNLKIRISSIQFAPNSAALVAGVDPVVAQRNMSTIRRLAEILGRYPAYQIRIEGHAVSEYWDNAARAAREEREELLPLSKARADAVKAALVQLGIPAARMTTDGIGGQKPVVPHGDLDNRWKNRRVEFLLIR